MNDPLAKQPISPTLLWLTGLVLALTVVPHWSNLSIWVSLAFFMFLALRALFWRSPYKTPSHWLLVPLVLGSISLVLFQAGLYEGRQFGVALLIVMAGLKFLELKSRRDIYIAVFLGYFLLSTLFLYRQTPSITFYVLLLGIALTALLIASNQTYPEVRLGFIGRRALWLTLSAIPVMVILFVFFPRLDGPLWTLSLSKTQARTGISDHIQMGAISELSQSDEVAFRVRFLTPAPPRAQWYWRGLVLWKTDGKNWTRSPSAPQRPLPPSSSQAPWKYEITMEASQQQWLFPLDALAASPAQLRWDWDGQLTAQAPIERRFTFQAQSHRPTNRGLLDGRAFELGLQLPESISPRLRQLVSQWQRNTDTEAEIVQAALDYFHRQGFVYTLFPPLLGDDPVDEFLFETRRGFCEHYATSFVILMRLAGIPARVIVGYQGGERNPMGGHVIVRQSDAHAWAEVWLEDSGWTRIDPTAAISPTRIEHRIDLAQTQPGQALAFDLGQSTNLVRSWMKKWDWLRDNLELSWHYWVIGFDRSRQHSLWQQLGLSAFQPAHLAIAGILLALISTALFFLWNFKREGQRSHEEALHTYRRLQKKLRRCGVATPSSLGPLDLRRHAIRHLPHHAQELDQLFELYTILRYGRNPSRRLQADFKRAVRRFRCRARKSQSKH